MYEKKTVEGDATVRMRLMNTTIGLEKSLRQGLNARC